MIDRLDDKARKKIGINALVVEFDKIQFGYNLGVDFDERAIEMLKRAKTESPSRTNRSAAARSATAYFSNRGQ